MTLHILNPEIRRFGRILHYAGLLATIAFATASYSLLHVPIYEQISEIDQKIEELSLSAQNAEVIHVQHQKASERLMDVKKRIAKVQERVPRDADAGEFLNEVTRIAAQENLIIKRFKPEKPLERDGYTQMEVTLMGRGNYTSICTFFDHLSRLKRLSKLQNLTLTAEGNTSEYPMDATLIIYYGLRANEAKAAKEVKRG